MSQLLQYSWGIFFNNSIKFQRISHINLTFFPYILPQKCVTIQGNHCSLYLNFLSLIPYLATVHFESVILSNQRRSRIVQKGKKLGGTTPHAPRPTGSFLGGEAEGSPCGATLPRFRSSGEDSSLVPHS